MTCLALLLSAFLGLARAQDEAASSAAPQQDSQSESVRAMQDDLRQDPAAAEALANRILRSGIGERISGAADPQARLAGIRKWIADQPDSAAHVAIGLAQDDKEGGHDFEEAVLRNTSRSLSINSEHVSRSAYGRLKDSSAQSKLMGADAEMADEEKREILKSMFEGRGSMSNQIITQVKDGKTAASAAGGAGFAGGYYDRLSRFNLRGYSPQLMAMQSALNQRRAPGAPKLLETGKLDYETLSYPAYAMRYDLRNLAERLRYQENFELARLAGLQGRYRPEQLLDPEVEAQLKRQAAGKSPGPRFASRKLSLERAAAALRDFELTALAAKDPKELTRGLLASLGAKQAEAARWITAASLEDELQNLESEAGFFSDELKAVIAGSPLPEATRAAYQRRGEGFVKACLKIKSNAEDAVRRLESPDWRASVAAVEAYLAENAALRKDLSRNIRNFVNTPYRLRSLYESEPRWRHILESAVERYLPSTPWGRRLHERARQRDILKDVFNKIAAGDLDAADTILSASAPTGATPR